MSAVYRVTLALPEDRFMTLKVEAKDRDQAKARALNQARADGHRTAAVAICRKWDKPTVFGNWPAPPNGGRTA